jgi:hypothetical protein
MACEYELSLAEKLAQARPRTLWHSRVLGSSDSFLLRHPRVQRIQQSHMLVNAPIDDSGSECYYMPP